MPRRSALDRWSKNICGMKNARLILTSATLTTHGEFQYLRNTLGADEADEMQLGSPYDYESAALLYIANDIPEPNVQWLSTSP